MLRGRCKPRAANVSRTDLELFHKADCCAFDHLQARRYPGSLVARFLVNRFYALRRKYAKPSSKPGRFDFIGHWILNWEGLLIGGVFVGGLGLTAVNIYIEERLDDIARRAERCQLYDSSCVMEASHLTSVQSSLALYKVLREVAAQRSSWHEHCRHTHQHNTQLASDDVKAWRMRVARTGPQSQRATADGLASSPATEARGVEGSSGGVGLCSCGISGANEEEAAGSITQGPHQPAEAPCEVSRQAQQVASTMHQVTEEEEQQEQQQQSKCLHHQHCTISLCVTQPLQAQQQQQDTSGENVQGQKPLEELSQQPHHHHQNQQQQQQQQPSFLLRPAHWYCCRKLRHAEQRFLERQQGLHLSERGLHMWQQIGQHAAQQVELLEEQQQQHMLMLMAHAAQRARWHQLGTYTTELEFWFELPTTASIGRLVSTLGEMWSGTRSNASPEQHATAAATATHAADQEGPGCETGAAGQDPPADQLRQATRGSKRLLGAGLSWFATSSNSAPLPTGDTSTAAAEKRAPANTSTTSKTSAAPSGPEPPCAWQCQAAEATITHPRDVSTAVTGSQTRFLKDSQTRFLQRHTWMRVRLLLPQWIPAAIEEQDEALLCTSPYTAVDRSRTAPDQEQQQQQQQRASHTSRGDLGAALPSDEQHKAPGNSTAGSGHYAMKGYSEYISSGSSSSGGSSSSSMVDAALQPAVAEAAIQDTCGDGRSPSGGVLEVEPDDGGVLADLIDEALDVFEALWDAAA